MFRKSHSYSRMHLEAWLGTLDIDAEAVADVGGRGLPVKNRVKSWKVGRYDVLDLDEYDLNQEWDINEVYDAAFCLEVFEYVYNPLQAMRNLNRILKSGGVLYASFHFIYPHHGPRGMDYLRYTRWGVDKLLEEAGFRSWERYSRPFRRPWGPTFLYLGEKMKGIDKNQGQIHEAQGYLVKALK
ncbi:MAG TPA: class I SAM-dependent methyltransferase [Desulfobaccales bacterium]